MRLTDWRNLRAHVVWAYESVPLALRGTFHDEHLVGWRLLEGSVTVSGRRKTVTAAAGQWVFPPRGEEVREFSEDARVISVHFRATWPDGHELFQENEPHAGEPDGFPDLDAAARRLAEIIHTRFPDVIGNRLPFVEAGFADYLALESGLPAWLDAYATAMQSLGARMWTLNTFDERVVHLSEAIDALPLDAELSLADVAGGFGLSPGHASRLFVAQFGFTPREYREQQRVDAARRLLRGSCTPVKEIAFNLGFKQPTHFSAWFKKRTGRFPRAFRDAVVKPSEAM